MQSRHVRGGIVRKHKVRSTGTSSTEPSPVQPKYPIHDIPTECLPCVPTSMGFSVHPACSRLPPGRIAVCLLQTLHYSITPARSLLP